ncbi:rhamnulokinase [Cryobacterium tepidiphilum]|uniref:Rhamnulokinase n=1 Tax=Cryobacterium tepidiphilum TaxID=2486026 RepID=A0A3M8LRF7_9MICO|nr:rhamnulokinase family protein [Cryobacterium tepidiphilum]RNE67088.1 rhamnulokinase [Cryobacterium tepidiphilum]
MGTVAAIDLGASSGRVMIGTVGPNTLSLRAVARFPNTPVRTVDGLHWNILELYRSATAGLAAAFREEPGITSIGVDSWAVDYALMSGQRMLGQPFHYRDERTAAGVADTHAVVSPAELYATNGLQFLPFNTLYQLADDRHAGALGAVDTMLLIPDLFTFWLTGVQVAERTNASTTGLLRVDTGTWDDALISRLGLPRAIFPRLVDAGTRVGPLLPAVAAEIGAPAVVQVTAVGSHDTASAVVGVPMTTDDAAYISSGTWSLVGVELGRPVLGEAGRLAGFTNEGGVDGRIRYLHNVMGLWLLSESVRTWEQGGDAIALGTLLEQAALAPSAAVFDVEDPRFLAPGDMPARIAGWFTERGLAAPATRPELVRSILESLAAAYARTLDDAARLSGTTIRRVHIVGGGSQNALLCQLTADATGLPVLAGPVEATAIGNVLVQARAQRLVTGDLETLRALIAAAYPPVIHHPRRAPRTSERLETPTSDPGMSRNPWPSAHV